MDSFVLILHVSTTLFLAGLIWTVQCVHYPAFHFVLENEFRDFHYFHSKKISGIVIPAMFLELFSTLFLLFSSSLPILWNLINLSLVALIWGATFGISVPLHRRLAHSREERVIQQLAKTNWLRTILWTIKAIFGMFLLSTTQMG